VTLHLPLAPEHRTIELSIDGRSISVREGATVLDACKAAGVSTPTLCFAENLTPVNVCRVCVVELEGARVLVPACSRKAEAKMKIQTDSARVRLARKMVLEFLASSVDVSTAPAMRGFIDRYGADPTRYGSSAAPANAGERDAHEPGHHHPTDGAKAATVHQPVKVDNDLYVRDYGKCILCYKCVEACGHDAQNTFAIAVAGRGFDARISTELAVPLPESACVYCARDARRRHLERRRANEDRDRVPVLRRRLRARAPRPRRRDREGDVADRVDGDERQPLHQRPLRLLVRQGRSRLSSTLTTEPRPAPASDDRAGADREACKPRSTSPAAPPT
jgi:NAD-dependent dihydropyrimidine dehydrogenase PreA subunit/ferredoxin